MDEVSPAYLRDGVEFQIKLRGYDPVQVDEFLDRVAGGIEMLQQQLRQAIERAARAEQQASESAEGDQSLRRTLLLAQRAADLATEEAKEYSEKVRADAEAKAARLIADAETEARRNTTEAERTLRLDVARLEIARANLQADVDALGTYLQQERARIRQVLSDQRDRFEQLADLAGHQRPPEIHAIEVPAPPPELHAIEVPPIPGETEAASEPAAVPPTAEPEPATAPDEPAPGSAESARGPAAQSESTGLFDIEVDLRSPVADQPVTESGEEGDDDYEESVADPYMAELRKSLEDDSPSAPGEAEFFDVEPKLDMPERAHRWGLRRRR